MSVYEHNTHRDYEDTSNDELSYPDNERYTKNRQLSSNCSPIQIKRDDESMNNFQSKKLKHNSTQEQFQPVYNAFNTFNQSVQEDELTRLKRDEANRELNYKEKQIQLLKEELAEKSRKYKSQDNKLRKMREENLEIDKLKSSLYNYESRLLELERENEIILMESNKLKERLTNKDKINLEFQSLTKITVNKINQFENINNSLLVENELLRKENNEIKQKIILIYNQDKLEKQEIDGTFDIDVEIIKISNYFTKLTDNLFQKQIEKYEKQEKQLKNEFNKEKEELNSVIKKLNEDQINSKQHYLKIKKNLEDTQKLHKETEFDNQIKLDNKERELEKSFNTIKLYQKEIKEINNEFSIKINNLINQIKTSDEKERKAQVDNEIKNKKIDEFKKEKEKFNLEISNLNKENKRNENKILEDENTIKKLNEIILSLNKQIVNHKKEFNDLEESKNKEKNILLENLEEIKNEYKNLYDETEELRAILAEAQEKNNELNDFLQNKQTIEIELNKEKSITERLKNDLIESNKKYKILEEKANQKINALKRELIQSHEKIEENKYKYERKVNKLIIKNEEEVYSKSELTNQVKQLKDALDITEKQNKYNQMHNLNNSFTNLRKRTNEHFNSSYVDYGSPNKGYSELNYTYNHPLYNENTNDKDNIKTLSNLKHVLKKIDQKINDSSDKIK